MFYILILALAIVLGLLFFLGEQKRFPALFLGCAIISIVIGLGLFNEGVTFDYGTTIQQGVNNDLNLTKVDYNMNAPFTLTTNQDFSITAIAYFFSYGSILFLLWAVYRSIVWSKEEIRRKYAEEQ